jgi:FkbM family methyltransferase
LSGFRDSFVAGLERWCPPLLDTLRVLAGRQFELWPLRRTFAQPPLHAFLREQFAERGVPGRFLEAGANDGLRQSNTAYLERYCGWTGILVEPLPHRFVECVRNRPRARVEHCALVSEDFRPEFVELQFNDLMTRIGDADIDGAQGLSGASSALCGARFMAPARTLDDVLRRCGDPEIDLLSLDVEGYEMEVLRGARLDRRRIRSLLVECGRLDDLTDYLASFGYRFVRSITKGDHFFVLEGGTAPAAEMENAS